MPSPARISNRVVGTTAVLVVDSAPYAREILLAQVAGAGIVYVAFNSGGGSGRGFPIPSQRNPLVVKMPPNQTLWAVGTSATDAIAIWEQFGED